MQSFGMPMKELDFNFFYSLCFISHLIHSRARNNLLQVSGSYYFERNEVYKWVDLSDFTSHD